MKRVLKDALTIIVILLALLSLVALEAIIDWIASFEFTGDLLMILLGCFIAGLVIASIVKPNRF